MTDIEKIKVALASRPAPMQAAIDEAVIAANRSPCRKSKRGAAVFQPFIGKVCLPGMNSRPDFRCDGICYRPDQTPVGGISICAQMCLHAEQRAIRFALREIIWSNHIADGDFAFAIEECELVHVKVNDAGELVPSGPPSCVWCAKEVLDVGLLGVWLYEESYAVTVDDSSPKARAEWNFYPVHIFWERTLFENHIGVP